MTETASSRNDSKPETGERGLALEALERYEDVLWEQKSPTVQELEEMVDKDGTPKALKKAVTLPIRKAPRDVEEAEGGTKEAEFVREVLLKPRHEGGMTSVMDSVISQMAFAQVSKKAFFEKVWELRDGKYVYKKIAYRPASTCSVIPDDNGSFNGFRQEFTRDGKMEKEDFNPNKAFVYIHGSDEKPLEGESAFSAVWEAYKHKRRVLRLLFEHLQLYALGIKVTKYGGDEQDGAKDLYERAKKVRGGGTMAAGKDDEIELLKITGASAEFREVSDWLNAEMARSLLAQWMLLGTGSDVGSWALSRDHSDFFLQALQAVLDEIEWHVNEYLIPPLVEANFGVNGKSPKLVFQPLAETTQTEAFEAWKTIIGIAQPNIRKPGILDAIEEKVAQRLDIDPEKLEEAEEAPEEPPENPEGGGLTSEQRAVMERLGVTPQNNGQDSQDGSQALSEEDETFVLEVEDEDGDIE